MADLRASGDRSSGARRRRPDGGTARAALRLFREPVWVRMLLLVMALSVVFVLLGRWQWHRHVSTSRKDSQVIANYNRAPVPLIALLPTVADRLPAIDQWRSVRVSGRYDSGQTVLVRNRPLNGDYGYEVLVPLRTPSGALLLVDRGWIPNGQTGARPDSVPAPPAGTVQVVARLRPTEPPLNRSAPPGQALRIDLPRIAATLDAPSYRAYGVLASESPGAATAPTLLPEPSLDPGPYLSYAVQWGGFAVTAYALLGYYAYREAGRRADLAAGLTPEEIASRRRSRRPEEDEDQES